MVPIKISESRIARAYAVQSLQEVLKETTQEETTEGALKRATLCSEYSCQSLEVSLLCVKSPDVQATSA